ncbi:MAG TPA: MmgE/PrpD family protein, partial [Deltaproteobacteria bacterium]|nr:MmgE/PrpD family protein [Deltaproteobacteria bacterium]
MLTHDYARFAAQVHHMPIPPEVLHHAKRCLVDWFAATLPGGMLPPATLMTDALVAKHGTGEASLLPSGIRTDART